MWELLQPFATTLVLVEGAAAMFSFIVFVLYTAVRR